MTFKEVYRVAIKFWPSEVDIQDGKKVENNGGYFSTLSKIWDQAEIKTEGEPELIQLMIWSIFCGYHKKAVENYQKGIKNVFLTELDSDYIKSKFEESLFDSESDYYAEIKKEYTWK